MVNKVIARIINNLAEKDQKVRKKGVFDPILDQENTAVLKKIIKMYGWPTTNFVGKKASHFAWLLVQHADSDPKFQKHCLDLMEKNTVDWAYLTDRILINEGKPQIYGTQFYEDSNEKLIPRPIKNINTLEKRRKLVGLRTFKFYKKQMEKTLSSP